MAEMVVSNKMLRDTEIGLRNTSKITKNFSKLCGASLSAFTSGRPSIALNPQTSASKGGQSKLVVTHEKLSID